MVGYIYKITNSINGKIYIGQTSTTIEHRWRKHIIESNRHKSNNKFYNAIRKYLPVNFNVEELIRFESSNINELRMLLDKSEIYFIAKYDSYRYGYNSNFGGHSNLGYKPTKETLKKLSDSHKGQNNQHLERPILQYSLDGELLNEWSSTAKAAKSLGIKRRAICNCLNGYTYTSGGFKWEHKTNKNNNNLNN